MTTEEIRKNYEKVAQFKDNKTMTANEFKKVLTDAGLNFDVYKYEGILNLVIMCMNMKADEYNLEGCEILSEMYREYGHNLYSALCERGYYNY